MKPCVQHSHPDLTFPAARRCRETVIRDGDGFSLSFRGTGVPGVRPFVRRLLRPYTVVPLLLSLGPSPRCGMVLTWWILPVTEPLPNGGGEGPEL